MTPAEFRAWRERCGYPSWDAVALALGKDVGSVKRYAVLDTTKSHARPIPTTVEFLCRELEKGRSHS
jgi:hypothetical protein